MSDTTENPSPEPVPDSPTVSAPAAPTEPIVVVQYRDRFLPSVLIIPLLILLLSVTAAALIRASTPDWPALVALRAHRAGQPAPTVPASLPSPEAALPPPGPAAAAIIVIDKSRPPGNAPLDLKPTAAELAAGSELEASSARSPRPQKATSPAAKQDADPAEPPDPAAVEAPPVVRHAPVAIGFDPPGTPRPARHPDEPAVADRDSDTRRAREEIAREAAALHARRQQLEAQKPLWLEQNALQSEQNHGELLARALAEAEADRPRFQAELHKLLADHGAAAGPQIEALCDDYGRDLFPEIEDAAARKLSGSAARLNRAEKVRLLRSLGFTEQRVLIYLWKLEAVNVMARGGPHDDQEALVWAARQLLAVSLTKPGPATVRTAPPPRARPVTARRSASRSAGAPRTP